MFGLHVDDIDDVDEPGRQDVPDFVTNGVAPRSITIAGLFLADLSMTYCVAMCVDDGLVFLSDTRTNAGVDHISTARKMSVFEQPGERVLVLLGAGNLSLTQAVLQE